MKEKASQPEVQTSLIEEQVRFFQFNPVVPEEGTEEKDFKSQSCNDASGRGGTVDIAGLNPGEGFLLAADRRDMERNGRTPPF